jgi:hypothetical protein
LRWGNFRWVGAYVWVEVPSFEFRVPSSEFLVGELASIMGKEHEGGGERRRASPAVGLKQARWLLWAGVLLLPLLAAGWISASRTAEIRLLDRARAQLDGGDWEAALASLEPLSRRLLLSREARRKGAELLFRLGEDQKAHRLLGPEPFNKRIPEDLLLRERSIACQRAAHFLRKADQSRDPAERVRFTRIAHVELPESPRVLQRLVREELLAMAETGDREYSAGFEKDYAELRRKAPRMADQLKQEVRESISRK